MQVVVEADTEALEGKARQQKLQQVTTIIVIIVIVIIIIIMLAFTEAKF